MDRMIKLDASQQWRKLIKLRPFLEYVLEGMREVVAPQVDGDLIKLRGIFVRAYKMGITSTNDPDNVYAKAAVPLLHEMIELQGKMNLFPDQGSSLCDLAEMERNVLGYYNKDSVAYYKRASDIAVRHVIPSVQARACLGLGQVARYHNQYEEAATLLRTAVAAAAQGNSRHEVHCLRELIEVLFEINSTDEAETLIQLCPALIQKATGPDFKGLTHMHLHYHLQTARVHEARGNPSEAEREVRTLIALVHANKSAIHDWRPTFLKILEVANKKLTVLDPNTGNKSLVKSMAGLARMHRMSMDYERDGVVYREILIHDRLGVDSDQTRNRLGVDSD